MIRRIFVLTKQTEIEGRLKGQVNKKTQKAIHHNIHVYDAITDFPNELNGRFF